MIHAKVLVVDHAHGADVALTQGLARRGYELHTAATLASAVALAGAHAYQVALVSLALACDQERLAALHEVLPAMPIIVMHAPSQAAQIPQSLLEMAANLIVTPLTLGAVSLMLDRTLELVALREQVRQQRQFWCQPQVAELDGLSALDSTGTLGRLEDVLTRRLRALLPSLALLGKGSLHHAVLGYVEKLLLTVVVDECRGNQVKAATILGINRNTLRKKIHELGLSLPHHTP